MMKSLRRSLPRKPRTNLSTLLLFQGHDLKQCQDGKKLQNYIWQALDLQKNETLERQIYPHGYTENTAKFLLKDYHQDYPWKDEWNIGLPYTTRTYLHHFVEYFACHNWNYKNYESNYSNLFTTERLYPRPAPMAPLFFLLKRKMVVYECASIIVLLIHKLLRT